MKRRRFLSLSAVGAAGTIAAAGAAAGALVRMLVPDVYYESPRKLKIGYPSDFPSGAPTFLAEERLYVFRDPALGFSAASAVCTHLGCTVRYEPANRRFVCPCHASVFGASGRVERGPAPRPLEWLEVTLAKDGQLQVDRNRKVADGYHLMLR